MKKILLLFCLIELSLAAQMPAGTKLLSPIQRGTSFMLKSKAGEMWIGNGAMNSIGTRYNLGLSRLTFTGVSKYYPTGIFTDGIEYDNDLYFTAWDALYSYRGNAMQKDESILKGNCITEYKNELFIGSMTEGLYHGKWGSFQKMQIIVNSKSYDSIYSFYADGNILWIGTSNGLIKYDGSKFEHISVPVKHSESQFIQNRQRHIISLQKDYKNRLWILNANMEDSLSGLYFYENNKFTDIKDFYADQCYETGNVPSRAYNIERSSSGAILLGTWWGMIEFSEVIRNYVITPDLKNLQGVTGLRLGTGTSSVAIETPDQKVYVSTDFGIVEIDRSKYELSGFLSDIYKPYYRNSNTIDINDISAGISNDGAMFDANDLYKLLEKQAVFNVKSLGCAKPMYSAGIWMGGKEKGTKDLHVSAQTYRQRGSDFVPGPMDTLLLKYDSTMSRNYNKVWKIDQQTIDDFLANRNKSGYVIPQAILDWPGNAPPYCLKEMAPYHDVDLNGKYEPINGDYPKIKGAQMLWWVFNDIIPHTETGGRPLQVQINASCYAYKDIRLTPADSNFVVNRSIFLDYKVFNLGKSLDSFYMGIMNDADVGNYSDDFMGCDSSQNAAFAYNKDNYDEDGFGLNPPMVLCKFLNRKMSNFIPYNYYSGVGIPVTDKEYYYYLASGTTYNGNFIYMDPYPLNEYPCNAPTTLKGDIRYLMSCNKPEFKHGESFNLEMAYVIIHEEGVDLNTSDCDRPSKSLKKIQNWYDNGNFPSKAYWGTGVDENKINTLNIYPNPSNATLNIECLDASNDVEIVIVDQTGKTVYSNILKSENKLLSINISDLSSGVYILKIKSDTGIYNMRFVKQD